MAFDVNSLLQTSFEETNSTEMLPVPAGEFLAVAESFKIDEWQGKKDPSQRGLKLIVKWNIDDANVKQAMGRDKVSCNQEIMLDMTESGMLSFAKGDNVGLGRLREALGLNTPGAPFSFSMITGRLGKVRVEQEIYEEKIYARIKAVAKV